MRGGHHQSLASHVIKALRDGDDLKGVTNYPRTGPKRSVHDPLDILAGRVSAKLEEGDFKGAVRLACSEDRFALPNETTLCILKNEHPDAHL